MGMFPWGNKKQPSYSFGRSRKGKRAANNLGVIELDLSKDDKVYRDPQLEIFDAYYENRQYEKRLPWEQDYDAHGSYIPIRARKPSLRIPFAKLLCGRLTSMLIGGRAFPNFIVKDFPDEQEFFRAVIRESRMKSQLLEPVRRLLNTGSCFVRFYLSEGALKMEWFAAKYCYPTFSPAGELTAIEIKYVYVDKSDRDEDGNFKTKWFKMQLDREKEVMFDNPDYEPDSEVEPEFKVVDQVEHGMGFVQGTWFRVGESRGTPDGMALVADVMDFIDELCYSFSQSNKSVSYNQDPQLAINGMTEEDADTLIRSASKSWLLGRDGKAEFLETNMSGVERAIELRDKIRQNIQDIARVLLLDPEKIVGNAQSAKAMEVLFGPMVELVEEIRGIVEPQLKELVLKMSIAVLIASQQGIDVPIEMPPGWQPSTLDLELKWNAVFEETMEDRQKASAFINSLTSSNLISRETGTRWLAERFPDLGITDVEQEIQKIAAQPVMNPFGAF